MPGMWKKYSQQLKSRIRTWTRNWRVIIAVILSSFFSLIIGLLADIAASFLTPEFAARSWLVWIALGIAFVFSLPLSVYLLLKETGTTTAEMKQHTPLLNVAPLPPRPYRKFFGREDTLNRILGILRAPNGPCAVGIDGMGGIGKTSLARMAAELASKEGLFEAVIWEPQATGLSFGTTALMNWSEVLTDIGRQLGASDIKHLPYKDKIHRLADLLKRNKVLLVFDNLESSVNSQDELVCHLIPLLGYSRALFTSRHRFKGDLYTIHLRGLDRESGLLLIRFEARQRGISRVENATSDDLCLIVESTGGSPLAIKLVVGQLHSLPVEQVIRALKEVRAPTDTDNIYDDEYTLFYKNIFWNSWQLLSEDAKRLLISMSIFAPGVGGTFETIAKTSNLDDSVLVRKIDELWRFSFLEISGGVSQRDTRYYLHQLTQYFVVSDIVNL